MVYINTTENITDSRGNPEEVPAQVRAAFVKVQKWKWEMISFNRHSSVGLLVSKVGESEIRALQSNRSTKSTSNAKQIKSDVLFRFAK